MIQSESAPVDDNANSQNIVDGVSGPYRGLERNYAQFGLSVAGGIGTAIENLREPSTRRVVLKGCLYPESLSKSSKRVSVFTIWYL